MSQTNSEGGTKIAQAAKDLNVTSVTIRRYIQEFEIATTADENGIKVLPAQAMQELYEIRRLKEDGLTNPKVMEFLAELREKLPPQERPTSPEKISPPQAIETETEAEANGEDQEKIGEGKEIQGEETEIVEAAQAGKSKHSLTCQTCGKVFEHMNPRLRDCLDCYRSKRKERRRGGSEKHKNVIQHPLAQQAANKSQPIQQEKEVREPRQAPVRTTSVRNYRKAIDETRHITSNLKRRLERPDLSEGERRWLEQIYAYQLILHQGWRHLAEYKQQGVVQAKPE